MKNGLWQKLAVAALAVVAIAYVAEQNDMPQSLSRQGNYLWRTNENPDVIRLSSLRLEKKDGFWRADNYYADVEQIDKLLADLRQTLYLHRLSALPLCLQPVELFADGREILNICLAQPEEGASGGTVIMGEDAYATDYNLLRSEQITDWILQPLAPLAAYRFEMSNLENFAAADFRNILILRGERELPKEELPEKKLQIVTAEGITIDGSIFKDDNAYWLTFVLGVTVMPQTKAAEFVKNNGFLYKGWYFQISPEQGSRLFNAVKEP